VTCFEGEVSRGEKKKEGRALFYLTLARGGGKGKWRWWPQILGKEKEGTLQTLILAENDAPAIRRGGGGKGCSFLSTVRGKKRGGGVVEPAGGRKDQNGEKGGKGDLFGFWTGGKKKKGPYRKDGEKRKKGFFVDTATSFLPEMGEKGEERSLHYHSSKKQQQGGGRGRGEL